ncbi:hypothetical protein ACLOJK_020084 [Asimina triloba]
MIFICYTSALLLSSVFLKVSTSVVESTPKESMHSQPSSLLATVAPLFVVTTHHSQDMLKVLHLLQGIKPLLMFTMGSASQLGSLLKRYARRLLIPQSRP